MRQACPLRRAALDGDLHAFNCRPLYIELTQSLYHRADTAVANDLVINFDERRRGSPIVAVQNISSAP